MKNIARFLFAIPFAVFGLFHFLSADQMAGMVPIPGGAIWVYITGLCLLAASISFVIKKKVKLAGTLLAVMLIVFVALIHIPAVIAGDQMAMSGVLKDLSLAGGALLMAEMFKND